MYLCFYVYMFICCYLCCAAVMSVDMERAKLEKEVDELNDLLVDEECEDHDEIVDRVTQVINTFDQ